jgi:anti-anti-sigma factor
MTERGRDGLGLTLTDRSSVTHKDMNRSPTDSESSASPTSSTSGASEPAAAPGPFAVNVDIDGAAAQVALSGELDIGAAPALADALDGLGDEVNDIVLDLRGLSFIDSSGLRVILRADANARANGHDLHVVRGTEAVQRVFELTRMDERLNMLSAPDGVPDAAA